MLLGRTAALASATALVSSPSVTATLVATSLVAARFTGTARVTAAITAAIAIVIVFCTGLSTLASDLGHMLAILADGFSPLATGLFARHRALVFLTTTIAAPLITLAALVSTLTAATATSFVTCHGKLAFYPDGFIRRSGT
jgi:hypothetical protein